MSLATHLWQSSVGWLPFYLSTFSTYLPNLRSHRYLSNCQGVCTYVAFGRDGSLNLALL